MCNKCVAAIQVAAQNSKGSSSFTIDFWKAMFLVEFILKELPKKPLKLGSNRIRALINDLSSPTMETLSR